jgi:hypothetical protein
MSYKRQPHHIQQNHLQIKISQPVYQSTMSAEQKHTLIADSVASSINMDNNFKYKKIKGCQMHPELSKKCRKCKEIV